MMIILTPCIGLLEMPPEAYAMKYAMASLNFTLCIGMRLLTFVSLVYRSALVHFSYIPIF